MITYYVHTSVESDLLNLLWIQQTPKTRCLTIRNGVTEYTHVMSSDEIMSRHFRKEIEAGINSGGIYPWQIMQILMDDCPKDRIPWDANQWLLTER